MGNGGSSTSSGEEDRRNKSFEAGNRELRAGLEALEKRKVKESKSFRRGENRPGRREWCVEMVLDDEAESRKKLDR